MPIYSNTFSPTVTREYYGPSIKNSREQPELLSRRPPSGFYEDSGVFTAAAVTAGIFASGYIPYGQGRLWDKYVGVVRGIEEYSPGGIFRTFQASTWLSQFTSQAAKRVDVLPEFLRSPAGRGYASYLANIIGEQGRGDIHAKILREGVSLRGGKLFFGTGEEVALQYASALISPVGKVSDEGAVFGRHYGSAYARSAGFNLRSIGGVDAKDARLFGEVVEKATGPIHRQIIGAHTLPQHIGRQMGGWGTEWVSRFNRLLQAPFEMQPFSTLFSKFQDKVRLGVSSGPGLRMLGALSWKYGALATGAVLGYQTVDYQLRQSELLEGTTLGEGLTATLGTGLVQANLLASEVANIFGLHKYRELQEELAPGSTEFSRLLAFPLMGALGAAGIGYGMQAYRMAKMQIADDITAAAARSAVSEGLEEWGEKGLWGHLGKQFASTEGLYSRSGVVQKIMGSISEPVRGGPELKYKFLGKMTPGKLAGVIGAGIGAALITPFLPGALVPDERPEELEAIYSGEQEVAVRRGRWWEFGKCLTISTTYKLLTGEIKTSEQIEIGDTLIGRNNKEAKVVQIYTRRHCGEIRKFYTAHDRDIPTGTTSNHIIPVLRNEYIQELEAKDIKINDYVEVPYRKLEHNLNILDVIKIIKSPVFVIKDRVFSTQKNWYSGKLQKSGKHSIPTTLVLDYDLGLLFGYFLAEGNLSFNSGNPTIIETVHAKSEYDYVLDIERIVKEKFNTQITTCFKTTGKKTKEGCWIVRICNSILAKLFRWLFFPETYSAHEKHIPDFLLNSNSEFKEGLIEGYWRGDGHLDNTTRVITSARKHLLTVVQEIALNLGQPCGISKHSSGQFSAWRLRFYHSNANNPGSKFRMGRYYTRIRKIEIEEYDDLVYDFEVDHPDHLLQAGTFLVHNSPWEGNRIAYFRPHWYPRLRMRGKEVSIWGEDEPSPLDKLLTREFTYDLEKEFYEERPYPITSLPFEDVPFIGPLLANTIGKIIKPPMLMHTEEWLGEGGVKSMPAGFGGRVAIELGEGPHTVPISPYSLKGTIGEQAYRMTEMIGLPGFMMTSVKEGLTGTPDLFDQMMQLESARRAYGFERSYWDLEIGGGLGTTEALRRLYPHRRRQVPLYNPIRNLMPDWLPGPGEKSPDFLHGDPYTKVPEGELRLPGKGYEARFPEVEGLSPEDYPAIHKYKILADVAPYSDKFKLALQAVRSARKSSTWSEYEEQVFQTTQEQVKQRKVRKEFEEYEYLSPMGEVFDNTRVYAEESTGLMATLNTMKANQEDEPGIFSRLFGGYWELLSHNAETALDVVTPVSPGAKLVHQRTAIEDYRTTQAFGTESAFWSHPIRDFILPFLTRSAASMGFEEIPEHLKDKRGVEEYFDILEYVKNTRLSNLARMAGDTQAVKEFENKKNETLFGINPYTYNYSHIFRSLPRSERDYFNSFVAADTMEERAEILSLVPENEKGLYVARWKLQFKEDVKKAKKAEMLSDDQVAEADRIIEGIETEARTEGMPSSKELLAEYLSTKMPGENYADWYRRTKLLAEVPLPGSDWVGWHPSVDLEDVKLKLVQSMGEDMHQYDLWPSRAQTLVNKPYINAQTLAPFHSPEQMSQDEMKRRVDELFIVNKVRSDTFFSTSWGTGSGNMIDLEQDVNIDDVLERIL